MGRDRHIFRRFSLSALLTLAVIAVACGSGGDENGPPTPTPTPLAAERAPTALVPVPPTPVVGTPTPGPASTPTSPGTGSPQPDGSPSPDTSTVGQTPGSTPAPTADSTVAPTPTPTPPPLAPGERIVQIPTGSIALEPGKGDAATFMPGAQASNFRVNVNFSNPFHPSFSPWNYGIKFRDNGQTYQMLVFDHEGYMSQINGQRNELETVQKVRIPQLVTSAGVINRFTFLVVEDAGFVLVNGELVAELEVHSQEQVGEISLVTDIYNQTVVTGATLDYFDLTINSAGLIAFDPAGELTRVQAGEPAVGPFSAQSSSSYIRVNLVSPINAFSGDYSYGVLFRSGPTGTNNWLVLDDSPSWRFVRENADGEVTYSSGNSTRLLRLGIGESNLLEIISTGTLHKAYMNGEFLANLDLPPGEAPYIVAPIAAFDSDHQSGISATEYFDFTVWSFE